MPEYQHLELETARGVLTAVVDPVGAALRSLSLNQTEFVLSAPLGQEPPFYAGVVMSPWVNRLEDGQWEYQGQTLQLPINLPEQQHAHHGLLHHATYRVVELGNNSQCSWLELAATINASPGYPFTVETGVRYELNSEGLRVTHLAENLSEVAAPYAVGGHPYLQISGTPTEQLRLTVPASSVILTNNRQIPVQTVNVENTEFDFRHGKRVDAAYLDHGFTDLEIDAKGIARTTLHDGRGGYVEVWQDRSMNYVTVFSPSFYPTSLGEIYAVAIEPHTAPANALRTGEGLTWLEPHQKFVAEWGINVSEPV